MPQLNPEKRKLYNKSYYLKKNSPIASSIEIQIIQEYKKILEFQNTHNSFMLWITKINFINIEILKNQPKL